MRKRIVIVAPHPDDETLGAGGTMAKYAAAGSEITVLFVSGHLPPIYAPGVYEGTLAEARAALAILGVSDIRELKIPATMVGAVPIHELNSRIDRVIVEARAEIVLCPFPDRHVDHRLIFDAVMVACRPVGPRAAIEIVAAYETLSETHWNAPHIEPNFVPNWTVDISSHIEQKLKAVACYASQIPAWPGPRSVGAVDALAKFRGTQAGFAHGEAFHVIRMRT